MKKLEIEKTKPTFITPTFKTDIIRHTGSFDQNSFQIDSIYSYITLK